MSNHVFIYKKSSLTNICPILLENIIVNEPYMTCNICKIDISYEALNEWFKMKLNCPNCRSTWQKENKHIYINSNKVLKKTPKVSNLNLISDESYQPSGAYAVYLNRIAENPQPSGIVNFSRIYNRQMYFNNSTQSFEYNSTQSFEYFSVVEPSFGLPYSR